MLIIFFSHSHHYCVLQNTADSERLHEKRTVSEMVQIEMKDQLGGGNPEVKVLTFCFVAGREAIALESVCCCSHFVQLSSVVKTSSLQRV